MSINGTTTTPFEHMRAAHPLWGSKAASRVQLSLGFLNLRRVRRSCGSELRRTTCAHVPPPTDFYPEPHQRLLLSLEDNVFPVHDWTCCDLQCFPEHTNMPKVGVPITSVLRHGVSGGKCSTEPLTVTETGADAPREPIRERTTLKRGTSLEVTRLKFQYQSPRNQPRSSAGYR